MKIVYRKSALGDLESIRSYIARDNPDAARRVVERIEQPRADYRIFRIQGGLGRAGSGFYRCLGCPTS